MSRATRVYLALVLTVATVLAAVSLPRLSILDPARFGAFLSVALLGSVFKVRIPGLTGTYSLNFIVILAAATELSLPELLTIVMGCAVIHSYWRAAKRPRAVQVAFNVANFAISGAGAHALFHAFPLLPDDWLFLPAILAAAGYYVLNTGMTAVVLCLVQGKRLAQVWECWTVYTLPYFLLGATLSSAWTFCNRQIHWQGVVVVVVALYLFFRLFRTFVSHQALEEQSA